MTAQYPRSTVPTPLSPRQRVAQAAQRRYGVHLKGCALAEVGRPCRECRHLDAVAAGLWVRADYRSSGHAAGVPTRGTHEIGR